MAICVYNMVGSDGSWFSPYGWRTRALLLAKQVPVQWVDLAVADMREALAFADTATTPLLIDSSEGEEVVLKEGWSIAQHIDRRYPEPSVFPAGLLAAIASFHQEIDASLQVPGFAAWSPNYFSSGVMEGADAVIFGNIVARATGRSVEENAVIHEQLVADFRAGLGVYESQLNASGWVFESFSYADITLFSCLKCFATVLRGIEEVFGDSQAFPRLRSWYHRMHAHCYIDDPY